MISGRTRRRVLQLQQDLIDGMEMDRFGEDDPRLEVIGKTISVRLDDANAGNFQIFCIESEEPDEIWLLVKNSALHGVYGSTANLVHAIREL